VDKSSEKLGKLADGANVRPDLGRGHLHAETAVYASENEHSMLDAKRLQARIGDRVRGLTGRIGHQICDETGDRIDVGNGG